MNPGLRCAHFEGTADFSDGKGTRALNAVYCMGPPKPASGIWASFISGVSVPQAFAGQERQTMAEVLQSFNVNEAVVQGEAAQIAAPAIARIHALGQAAANQAAAAHQREEIHNSSVYQHWDSMDRRSQEFENYQLGYSVIADTRNHAHRTFWNEDAAALVQSDPNRYEYVNAPDYWKGIDY